MSILKPGLGALVAAGSNRRDPSVLGAILAKNKATSDPLRHAALLGPQA